jgi:hypothetical protein
MRYQPNRNYSSNDDIQTPRALSLALIEMLQPTGRILEPCAGEGAFFDTLPLGTDWCEIKRGRDFFQCQSRVDWIVTNPPWSQVRAFLRHSFMLADHVAFLVTVNHAWTRARLRDMRQAGFGIEQIILVETPCSFPPSGFQLGMVVYARGHVGSIRISELAGTW